MNQLHPCHEFRYHLHHLVQTCSYKFSGVFDACPFFGGFEHHLQGFVSITVFFCPPVLMNILSGQHSSSKTCLNIPISSMKSTFTYSSPGKNWASVAAKFTESHVKFSIPSFLTFPKSSSNDQSHYLLFGVSLSLRGAMFLATFNDTSSCNLATRHLLEPWELGGFVLSLFGVLFPTFQTFANGMSTVFFFPKNLWNSFKQKIRLSMGASPKTILQAFCTRKVWVWPWR